VGFILINFGIFGWVVDKKGGKFPLPTANDF
jgi:hypothetical protein